MGHYPDKDCRKQGRRGRPGWCVSAFHHSPSEQCSTRQPGRMLHRPGDARMSSCRSPMHWFSAPAHPFPRTMTCGAHASTGRPGPRGHVSRAVHGSRALRWRIRLHTSYPWLHRLPCTDAAWPWDVQAPTLPAHRHCRATPVDLPGASTAANCAAGLGPARLAAPSESCGTATTTTRLPRTQRPLQRRRTLAFPAFSPLSAQPKRARNTLGRAHTNHTSPTTPSIPSTPRSPTRKSHAHLLYNLNLSHHVLSPHGA